MYTYVNVYMWNDSAIENNAVIVISHRCGILYNNGARLYPQLLITPPQLLLTPGGEVD